MLAREQEEELRAGAAEQETRLKRIEEDAAVAERRANALRSDAETQANRIVRLPPATASPGLVKPPRDCQDGRSSELVRLHFPGCEADRTARHHHLQRASTATGGCCSQCCFGLGLIGVHWLQLASARAEQERLQSEARRMRDAAHEQQLTVMRQSLSAAKVCLLPCLKFPAVPVQHWVSRATATQVAQLLLMKLAGCLLSPCISGQVVPSAFGCCG